MKTLPTRKKLHIVWIALAVAGCIIILPTAALADGPRAISQYSQLAQSEQLAAEAPASWVWPVIILGFIIVIAIMAHCIVVGKRKNNTNQL